MRHLILLIIAAILPVAAHCAPVEKKGSGIEFVSRQMGVPIKGSFKDFDADVSFDEKRPEKSIASISIRLDSVDAGSEDATTEVKRKPWFNVKEFPNAGFVSTKAERLSKDRFMITGNLSIKGKTRVVSAPVKVLESDKANIFEGSMKIKRLDFDIGEGAWADSGTVANEVEITFRLIVPIKDR